MMREDFTQAQIENQWEDLFGRSGMSTPLDIRAQRERQRTATNPFSSFLPSGMGAEIADQFLTETPEAVYYSSPVAEAFTREGITGRDLDLMDYLAL